MSRAGTEPLASGLAELLLSLAEPGQPQTVFERVDRALADTVGQVFMTVLRVRPDGLGERLYSNQPEAYPMPYVKGFPGNGWVEQVLQRAQPLLVRNMDEFMKVFVGRDVMESLGCGCLLNMPVIWDGKVRGTVNIGDREGRYDDETIRRAAPIVAVLGPVMALSR